MASKGKITSWNDAKGFGFITPKGGGAKVFCHANAFANRGRRPGIGDAVTYKVGKDAHGRVRATRATLARVNGRRPTTRSSVGVLSWVGLVFVVAVGVSALLGNIPAGFWYGYVAMSIITFIVYTIDKSAAQFGRWRIREATLHILALGGGWPGAAAAQQVLRHKSRKRSFRVVFWLTVVLNAAALAWLHTPAGNVQLDAMLGNGQVLLERLFRQAPGGL